METISPYQFTCSDSSELLITSDPHLGHMSADGTRSIIGFAGRPFPGGIEQHDRTLMTNWNEKVGDHQTIIMAGDFFLNKRKQDPAETINQLNGKIIILMGNHDNYNSLTVTASLLDEGKLTIVPGPYMELTVKDPDARKSKQFIVICHYPLARWYHANKGAWMLYGHVHGSYMADDNVKSIEIGVDCHDFKPWDYPELKDTMKDRRHDQDQDQSPRPYVGEIKLPVMPVDTEGEKRVDEFLTKLNEKRRFEEPNCIYHETSCTKEECGCPTCLDELKSK